MKLFEDIQDYLFSRNMQMKSDYGIKSVFDGLDWHDVCLDCQD